MRSADRRKAFFAVCMMAVLLFSHLGVCLWQTQIAQVQNLTAEAGGEAQGILRTTDSDYVSNALSAEPEAGLSQSMIVVTRKMTGAAEQRLFFHLSVNHMIAGGVDTFVEVGPGKVLSGFTKKIAKGMAALNVEDEASLEKTLAYFKEVR